MILSIFIIFKQNNKIIGVDWEEYNNEYKIGV